jgi:hypothetical protein
MLASVYANPELRPAALSFIAQSDETQLYPELLGRRIFDRVTVKFNVPGGGSAINLGLLHRTHRSHDHSRPVGDDVRSGIGHLTARAFSFSTTIRRGFSTATDSLTEQGDTDGFWLQETSRPVQC